MTASRWGRVAAVLMCGIAANAAAMAVMASAAGAETREPAKLSVARNTVERSAARLDVLAPITKRASGSVAVEFHAAGRRYAFDADVNSSKGWIRFRQRVPSLQARKGTGIVTIAYPGNNRTRSQEVRLRAASRRAELDANRPALMTAGSGLRLSSSGSLSRRAQGVVRVQLDWVDAAGASQSHQSTVRITAGKWILSDVLPAIVAQSIQTRTSTVHSYILFTGYERARMRGEMKAYQVLDAPATAVVPPAMAIPPAIPTLPSNAPPASSPPPPAAPPPPPVSPPEFTVPATTRIYDSSQIASAQPGPTDDQAIVTTKAGEPAPVDDGHVAIAPTPDLPHGMLGHVVSVDPATGGGSTAVIETAPLADVFDDVSYSFDGPVTPILVDENDQPVPGSQTSDGSVVIRGNANRNRDGAGARAATPGAFDCKNTSGVSVDQTSVWGTAQSLPIELKLEHTNVLHQFDEGSFFPSRQPFMVLQFRGDLVATIGFAAKVGFKCELSQWYRQNHRIKIPIRNIGPVPVGIYLEPTLKFSVSATGELHISRRHYFAYTLEKRDNNPLDFRRTGSADPPELSASARFEASLFAGGHLSLLVGASGKSISVGAGIYGDFGPEITLSTASADAGCIDAFARFRAGLGAQLNVWKASWSHEFASLTSPSEALPGSPYCGLAEPDPHPEPDPEPDPDPDPPPPDEQAHIAEITADNGHTCARRAAGTVVCWGFNHRGQLGDGTTADRLTPVTVGGLTDAVEINSSGAHTCARRAAGTVVCWGSNYGGHLGDGTTTDRLTPVTVSGLTDAVEISVAFHTCARRAAGTVVCWGNNGNGQLGDGTTIDRLTPVTVNGLTDAVEITADGAHTCARRAVGTVVCWGFNHLGRLGDGTESDRLSPVTVIDLSDAVEINADDAHTCARRAAGTVVCWGYNGSSQLGDGTTAHRLTPVTVGGLSDAVEITAGGAHTCARRAAGTVVCWGYNRYGQLGDGTTTGRSTPVTVNALTDAVEISAADGHTCARRAAGTVICWGFNGNGQLGDGTRTHRLAPVTVSGLP